MDVGGEFVIAGGEAAAVFQTAEHALDGIAALVDGLAEAAFPNAIALGRDVGAPRTKPLLCSTAFAAFTL